MSRKKIAVGIDLGTTASTLACVLGEGAPTIVANAEGGRQTPSAVYFGKRREVLVGKAALVTGEHRPEGLCTDWKRLLAEPNAEREVHGKRVTPLLLASIVLRRLVANVKAPVDEAVVAVPALFGDVERGAVLDAARVAGIASPRLVNEPTAAALDFALDPANAGLRRLLVYVLGASTFGATLVEVEAGSVRVLASAGERALGGRDWDAALADLVADEVYERTGSDPREDPLVHARLLRLAEPAKLELSREVSVQVAAPRLEGGTVAVTISRAAFEARARGLLDRTEAQLELLAERAGRSLREVDAVVAVGGATLMPMVAALLERVTGHAPRSSSNAREAIARGAALYASFAAGGGAHDLAREAVPKAPEAPAPPSTRVTSARVRRRLVVATEPRGGAPAPAASTEIDWGTGSGRDLPMLPGKVGAPRVRELLANALGVLVFGRSGARSSVVIPAQTEVPVERRKTYVTWKDGQQAVQVKVLEGDDVDPQRCVLVGTLVVDGLPGGRPKGQTIEITYRCDADSRLQVSARDLASGRQARATIERRTSLGAGELERLREEVAREVPV